MFSYYINVFKFLYMNINLSAYVVLLLESLLFL